MSTQIDFVNCVDQKYYLSRISLFVDNRLSAEKGIKISRDRNHAVLHSASASR